MARYDWGWSRGYDRDLGARGGYGSEYSGWGGEGAGGGRGWSGGAYGGYGSRFGAGGSFGGRGYDRDLGGYGGHGGYGRGAGYSGRTGGGYGGGGSYDQGLYGGAYPAYGGYPGGREQGMYYGGRSGYDQSYRSGGSGYGAGYGYGGGWSRTGAPGGVGRGYERGYAREPFMPEEAYRRHPEYDRPQQHMRDPWADAGRRFGMEMDDDEIRQVVRQSLYGDSWVDADGIEVEVNGGVVTLTGEVSDYMEARYAWDDAWESAGVRGVVNQLTVRTDQPQAHHGEVLPQSGGDQQRDSAGATGD